MAIEFQDQAYSSNETLKGFENTDALAKAYVDMHGRVSTGGIDLLPEELRKDPSISTFKNISDLAKGFVETKKMVGGFERAPEKVEDYKLTPMQNLHANVKQDMIAKNLLPVFHKAGMGPKMADTVTQGILSTLSQMNVQHEQARVEAEKNNETALRQVWGGDYDVKMDRIAQVMMKAGGKDIGDAEAIKKTLRGNPTLAKVMSTLTASLSEDTINSLGSTEEPITKDKAEAQEKIRKLSEEHGSKILDDKHAEHAKYKKEWDDLHAVLRS